MRILLTIVILIIYINVGYALAVISWNRYDSFRRSKKFSFINFLIWPISTLGYIGIIESGNDSPIIESFNNDTTYKFIVTFIWPLKIIFNTLTVSYVSFILIILILWRVLITLCLIFINIFIFYKKIYTMDLIKDIWRKPIAIKNF